MISDNLNHAFFKDEVSAEYDFVRPDGKIEVRRKGSLQLLEEWVGKNFNPTDPKPLAAMHATFKKIRNMRNKPSHSATEDEFSRGIAGQQRVLMEEAYTAVRRLRLVFANHPLAKGVEVDEDLFKGNIWPA